MVEVLFATALVALWMTINLGLDAAKNWWNHR